MNISGLFRSFINRNKKIKTITPELSGPSVKDEYKKPKPLKQNLLELELVKTDRSKSQKKLYDVRAKMVEATRIRREHGYGEAIVFLKSVAEKCLIRKLSDLVLCVNKLIPYMKQDPAISYEETCDYLDDILKRMPRDDGYYMNLFITKADLLNIRHKKKAINYLRKVLDKYKTAKNNINFYLKLTEYYIENNKKKQALNNIIKAKNLLKTKRERYSHIRKQKKWHGLAKLYSITFLPTDGDTGYLYHSFLEFLMSVALVTSPQSARLFRQYRENYKSGTWRIDKVEDFNKIISESGLLSKKEKLCTELYDYAFETMPEILGVTKKQLEYTRGEPESMEEISIKKAFPKKDFVQFTEIDNFVKKLLFKYSEN